MRHLTFVVPRFVGGLLILAMAVAGSSSALEGPGGGENDPFPGAGAQGSASLFTGAATVGVSIALPPGRVNTTPELEFRYSSHAGLSELGLGWSLTLGAVTRSVEHGVPRCGGNHFENFRVSLSDSSNDLVEVADDFFQSKIDAAYAEAIPDRGQNSWTLRTRNGMTYRFGGSPESRVHTGVDTFFDAVSGPAAGTPSGCDFTTAWHLTRIEDPNGNSVDIEYEKFGNTPIPTEIAYGGNDEVPIAHPFRVRIESEDLPTAKPRKRSFRSGVDQQLERRIKQVVVEAWDVAAGDFADVRRYGLHYSDEAVHEGVDEADDLESRPEFLLARISATGLPDRSFSYSTSTPTLTNNQSGRIPSDPTLLSRQFPTGPILTMRDMNGDGLMDRVRVIVDQFHVNYGESLSGDQFTAQEYIWRMPSANPSADRIGAEDNGQDLYLVLDLNGDGKQDFVLRDPAQQTIRVFPGECDAGSYDCGFSSEEEVWNNPGNLSLRFSESWAGSPRNLGAGRRVFRDLLDLNGDGLPDLVRAAPTGLDVYVNTGEGFEPTPIFLETGEDFITYTSYPNTHTIGHETQMIDLNGDGLADRVEGARFLDEFGFPEQALPRAPLTYFAVDPDDGLHGPFELATAGHLCPVSAGSLIMTLCYDASGYALPGGWAIVPAMSVRLHTGSGFTDPIYSPAPFLHAASGSAPRLRASFVDNTAQRSFSFRDFIDMDGDGRVDWVSGSTPGGGDGTVWSVLYNQGDGRFGTDSLQWISEATLPSLDFPIFDLGHVRSRYTIATPWHYLSETFHHSSSYPPGLSQQHAQIFDLDSDGIPELVTTHGMTDDRWNLHKITYAEGDVPHTRPHLLIEMDSGLGGRTLFRYRPSSDFVRPQDDGSGLPFSTWVVTAIRRIDGLCDTPPGDWFRLDENPCLASGHERVERFDYAEGAYDGDTRQFRGFGSVTVTNGPESRPSQRHVQFYQDEARKGRIRIEETYVGGVDLLSRTTNDWRTASDGQRTQVYLQEHRIEEFVLYSDQPDGVYADQCVVHRNSIRDLTGQIDPQTRIHRTCSMACEGAMTSDDLCGPSPVGKKDVQISFADPISNASHPVWDRPVTISTAYVDESGDLETSGFTFFAYDNLGSGVDRGNLSLERTLVSMESAQWIDKIIGHDNDVGPGVGNIVSVEIPVTGQAREPTTTDYDSMFRLYPAVERLPTTTRSAGPSVQQKVEKRFDLRYGKTTETVGVLGRAAGDVSGAVFDEWGRPVCEFEPGTDCDDGTPLHASVTYLYFEGDPNASNPIDRLSGVEVRRREPNAPNGHLVTKSYRDALGRERITTTEQFIVDPVSPTGLPSMQTVVRRHLEYDPHGRVSKRYAAYVVPPGGLSLSAPSGTSAIRLNYSLNGNGNGYWDPAGRVWEITQHDLHSQRKNYYGRTTREIDALGNHTLEHVDEHGRLVRREVFEAANDLLMTESAVYDGRDKVLREWVSDDLRTEITSRYDLIGRLVARDDPDSGLWTATYDEANNKIHADDPIEDQSVQTCFDELNRVVLECGRSTDAYDPALCDSAQPICSVGYRYVYDELTPIDPGASNETSRNGIGRLTSTEGPDSRHRYAYDVRGRTTQESIRIYGVEGSTEYDYAEDVDRIQSMTYPDGEEVYYAYDAAGRPTMLWSLGGNDGYWARYIENIRYDLLGRVLSVERGNGTSDAFTYYGPEENFRVDEIKSGSSNGDGEPFVHVRYDDYDGNGRLARITDQRVAGGPLSLSADYAFDGAGRLISVGGPNSETFAYDAIGNIVSINGRSLSVDPDDPSTSGPHQLTRFEADATRHWSMRFDPNGRRTSKVLSDGTATQHSSYGPFGRMRYLTVDGATKSMGYDHSGFRVAEIHGGSVRRAFGHHSEAENGFLHKYYFIGERLIATRTSPAPMLSAPAPIAFDPIRLPPEAYWALMALASILLLRPLGRSRRTLGLRVSQGGAIGSALLIATFTLPMLIGAGCYDDPEIRHYHLSQRSSPLALSGAGGELDRQYRYSAYGEVRRYDPIGNPIPIDPRSRREFTGYQTDAESELQYASARFYDPSQAQFLSLDPEQESANPYAYAGWDPIDFTDPSGDAAFTLAFLVFMGLSLAAVVVEAIITGVETSSWSNGFAAFGLGVGTILAGTIAGMVLPGSVSLLPGISQQAVEGALLTAGIGSSTYSVIEAGDTASAILAGVGLALTLSGAAYSLHGSAASEPGGGAAPAPDASKSSNRVSSPADGTQIAANGSNRMTFSEQLLKILRGSAEARILRQARLQNEIEIAALRGESASTGTVRGRPVGQNNVTAFEVISFTVDSAGNRSFNDSVVTVEFTARSAPIPTQPSLIGPGRPPFIRTVITGPHPIACGSCSGFALP